MTQANAPDFGDVESAAQALSGIAHVTPVLISREADRMGGASFFFKMENFQRGGAFKFRGAYNAISRLSEDARARGVVAFSSGNHAQAVALASRLLGVKACIVMPLDAPAAKLAATKSYGAEVVQYDRNTGDRAAIAREIAARTGASIIPPFDHPHIIAGQGTAARELFLEVGPMDTLYVPAGGGGLLAGSALAAAALSPDCHVIGVEPQEGDDMRQSLIKGEIVAIPTPATIADGAQTQRIGDIAFPILQKFVREVMVVDDDALRRQMRFFLERMKCVVEPTGCLGAASALATAPAGSRVGVIVSGGNVDIALSQDIPRYPSQVSVL